VILPGDFPDDGAEIEDPDDRKDVVQKDGNEHNGLRWDEYGEFYCDSGRTGTLISVTTGHIRIKLEAWDHILMAGK
jgi:hypothetical protein